MGQLATGNCLMGFYYIYAVHWCTKADEFTVYSYIARKLYKFNPIHVGA
jgi:hypothetical protein